MSHNILVKEKKKEGEDDSHDLEDFSKTKVVKSTTSLPSNKQEQMK